MLPAASSFAHLLSLSPHGHPAHAGNRRFCGPLREQISLLSCGHDGRAILGPPCRVCTRLFAAPCPATSAHSRRSAAGPSHDACLACKEVRPLGSSVADLTGVTRQVSSLLPCLNHFKTKCGDLGGATANPDCGRRERMDQKRIAPFVVSTAERDRMGRKPAGSQPPGHRPGRQDGRAGNQPRTCSIRRAISSTCSALENPMVNPLMNGLLRTNRSDSSIWRPWRAPSPRIFMP